MSKAHILYIYPSVDGVQQTRQTSRNKLAQRCFFLTSLI